MILLGIETSCDETAASLVADGRRILRSAVASQMNVHRAFRGVVPELASRAHAERINTVIEAALRGYSWKDVDGIGVTRGPGLVGCLLIGATTAQVLGRLRQVPVIGVNHLEGHLVAAQLEHRSLRPPFLGLIVSGGHTELHVYEKAGRYRRLGGTRDDAAGEAFDKIAYQLGLPFPGGPAIDRAARGGNPSTVAFPRAWMPGTWDFSFSGLKTSVINYLKGAGARRAATRDLAASVQEAIVDVLVTKTLNAAEEAGMRRVVVGGGVAANSRLRKAFVERAVPRRIRVYLPDRSFCTDNAAMVAAAAYHRLRSKTPLEKRLIVDPGLSLQSWKTA